MRKLISGLMIAAASMMLCAESHVVSVVTNADGKVVRKVDRAKLDEIMMKRTGGKIAVPGSLKGKIYYVNAQTRAPASWLEQNA